MFLLFTFVHLLYLSRGFLLGWTLGWFGVWLLGTGGPDHGLVYEILNILLPVPNHAAVNQNAGEPTAPRVPCDRVGAGLEALRHLPARQKGREGLDDRGMKFIRNCRRFLLRCFLKVHGSKQTLQIVRLQKANQ
jgi:hypothetical protein